ncbi:MAG: sigma-70 family RNA polymerase sigma factor [Candidatus Staskawiczbacteria bacterium]|nr:sigma-70 family RNA polymerase sigma factor [Candidatus Staskawiczbacteria bacterium]
MDSLNEQFSQIYDHYIDKIYRFVYLKVNSQEIAEDITSRVFLKGWEAYKEKFEIRNSKFEIKNMSAFLYQIARNAVVDHYRAKGRSKQVSIDAGSQITDPGVNAQDMAILNADISVVKASIQKLKKDYQDVIIWHYLEDMPIPEMAQVLGKPEGTVRVMLHRGLKELKDIVTNS